MLSYVKLYEAALLRLLQECHFNELRDCWWWYAVSFCYVCLGMLIKW